MTGRRHVRLHQESHGDPGRAAARELLGLGDAHPEIASATPDRFRVVRAEDAQLTGSFEHGVREEFLLLPLVDFGCELVLGTKVRTCWRKI